MEIDLHGLVLRYTTAAMPLVVTDHDGIEHLYSPGLDVGDIVLELGAPLESVGITIARGSQPSWARLRARGYRLGLATAIVRRHYQGQLLEQAEILMRGVLTGASYGGEHEPMTAGIERQLRGGGMIPGPGHRIDPDTWPVQTPDYVLDPASVGQVYPIPVGYPGQVEGDIAGPSTPVFLAEWAVGAHLGQHSTALVALGHVAAANITLHNISHPPHESTGLTDPSIPGPFVRPIILGYDLNNEPVSLIDWQGSGTAPKRETQYAAAWDQGGGVLNRQRTGPLRGAGEVLRWLLEEWTDIDVDSSRMEAQCTRLDAYKLDFCIAGKRSNVWDIIRSKIAPLLPVDWCETQGGGYYQLRRLDADHTQVTARLVATPGDDGANCVRTAPLQAASDRIYNQVTVLYAPGGQQGAYLHRVTVDADTSYRAAVSESARDTRELQIEAAVVCDRATAEAIGRDALAQWSIPRETTTVQGGLELDRLDAGDVVTVTDATVHLADELAIVTSKNVGGADVALGLLLLDDPARVLRGTT